MITNQLAIKATNELMDAIDKLAANPLVCDTDKAESFINLLDSIEIHLDALDKRLQKQTLGILQGGKSPNGICPHGKASTVQCKFCRFE